MRVQNLLSLELFIELVVGPLKTFLINVDHVEGPCQPTKGKCTRRPLVNLSLA